MSARKATTTRDIRERKGGTPIVCLTAYTTSTARVMDSHVDLVLVGDSLGMVVYGMETTLAVTLDMMVAHGAAVVRGCKQACVIVDLPFGSYQESPEQAFRSAVRLMTETGCRGVKLEGGQEMVETIKFLVARGIPVLAHVGLKPQSVNAMGGFRTQGRDSSDAQRILSDAEAVAKAGAFAVVVEGVVESLGREITRRIAVPTIGIGASAACDGQILVVDDILGVFSEYAPKFVKRYADLSTEMDRAIAAYADDVRNRRFPDDEHVFKATAQQR